MVIYSREILQVPTLTAERHTPEERAPGFSSEQSRPVQAPRSHGQFLWSPAEMMTQVLPSNFLRAGRAAETSSLETASAASHLLVSGSPPAVSTSPFTSPGEAM